MLQGIFITSTGTGIGKTLVTSALCYQLKSEARNRKPEEKKHKGLNAQDIFGFKPLATGFNEDDYTSDTWQIIASQGLSFTTENINIVSPFRFAAPLSPNMAASREGRDIKAAMLADYCCTGQQVKENFLAPSLTLPRKRERGLTEQQSEAVPSPVYGGGLGRGHSSYLGMNVYKIIEGIGGVMTPLNNHETVLDWVELLAIPLLLVPGSYLGTLSHTLTAYEVMRARGLTVKAIIVSETENSGVPLQETAATIEQHTKVNVLPLPRISDSATKWVDVPPLLHLL